MSPKSSQNTERINVFFSPDDLAELKQDAKRRGLTVSALVRMIVLEWMDKGGEVG